MEIVWSQEPPISSVQIFNLASPEKKWKPQTVLTLLTRLVSRGFLHTEKKGKERFYSPIVTREAYLNRETGDFVKRFHRNSLMGLMNALFSGGKPNKNDLDEIEQWLETTRNADSPRNTNSTNGE